MHAPLRKRALTLVALGTAIFAGVAATAPDGPAMKLGPVRTALTKATAQCEVATLQAFAPANTTIVTAQRLTTPVPYCRADGFVISRKPGPNQVNFMISLPDDFRGRYYMINSGGNSGFVPNPPADLLVDGYAIAGTDTGNQDRFPNLTYKFDRAKALDQAWRGTHLTAVSTQAITKGYYSVTKMFRYAVGCSGGGRLGLNLATTHPEDFDGVVAGAPGSGVSFPQQARIAQYGKLHPDAWISPAQLAQVDAAVTARYDTTDGALDGIVWDPSVIKFDDLPAILPFLTPAQLGWIKVIMSDLKSPDGREPYTGYIFPGYPITQTTAWSQWFFGSLPPDQWSVTSPNPAAYGFGGANLRAYFGPDFDIVTDMDFTDQSQLDYLMLMHNALSWPRSTPAELLRFDAKGGKIIFYADTSDHGAGYQEFINLYDDIWRTMGTWKKTQDFTRLFLAPGTTHCGGGPGPQDVQPRAFDALVKWVEQGVAPQQLLTSRPASASLPARTFLLCPYPEQAHYKSQRGSVNDASSWTCRQYFHPKKNP
jgi:feruloyl esterase